MPGSVHFSLVSVYYLVAEHQLDADITCAIKSPKTFTLDCKQLHQSHVWYVGRFIQVHNCFLKYIHLPLHLGLL